MDGYRQTLLGRALADALRELEKEQEEGDTDAGGLKIDGDYVFVLFDKAMRAELRDRNNSQEEQAQTFTHETLELTGQITAFNRFMEDWSLRACANACDIKLNNCVAGLHLPQQGQEVAIRLKLRQKT
ncbi:hypothetical protein DD237_007429 [Peronospora effusa]|uniref:Uncharacterized protein n=1 Tax=Peronospora effusa TaxID=542832 RepID=A0A425C750_9STRA|nr:hypothetical protein DD237_007429 [Peronospora effusa]